MKKVLIITYYWPPAGGPGVQRVLKFAKYLPQFGWQPIILTVANGDYPAIDETLKKDIPEECIVYKTNSLEPNNIYKKFTGMKKDEKIPVAVLSDKKIGWKKKIAKWIRLNLFIPDAKIGWIPFAVKKGKKIINELQPDIIFSSSPPPTVHLIAKKLAKWSGLKWVADFRDPWTDIHYYEDNYRNYFVESIDLRLEKNVLKKADKITCISQKDIEMDFGKKVKNSKCINIPNGFDESDFLNIADTKDTNDKFKLIHLGAINKERLPINLFKSIRKMDKEKIINPDNFILSLIGKVTPCVIKMVEELKIQNYVEFISYLPHNKAVEKGMGASILLLLITQSERNIRILPGKTFEYLRMGKPVLGLGPENGEVARIINETKTGKIIEYNDVQAIYKYLKMFFNNWNESKNKFKIPKQVISKYSRENLTRKIANVFNEIIKKVNYEDK